MSFRDEGDALRARNEALAEAKRALAEKESEAETNAQSESQARALAEREIDARAHEASMLRTGLFGRRKTLAQIEAKRAASASAKLAPRILSVFKRAWVVVVFWLPALLAILILVDIPEARLPVAAGLAVYATFVVCIDALLRRCPSCRRLLAGHLLSIVRDEYDFHVRTWKCVHCGRRWKTESVASTS